MQSRLQQRRARAVNNFICETVPISLCNRRIYRAEISSFLICRCCSSRNWNSRPKLQYDDKHRTTMSPSNTWHSWIAKIDLFQLITANYLLLSGNLYFQMVIHSSVHIRETADRSAIALQFIRSSMLGAGSSALRKRRRCLAHIISTHFYRRVLNAL